MGIWIDRGEEMTTAILALDLGTITGWALCEKDSSISSGSINFRPKRFESTGMRFLRFNNWIYEFLSEKPKVEAVFFEEVRRHAGVDAAHVYGGFMAILTACCEQKNIIYTSEPVGTIKKHATGKGNADKMAMIQSARAKGFSPVDDNEADAIALLHLAMSICKQ